MDWRLFSFERGEVIVRISGEVGKIWGLGVKITKKAIENDHEN